MESSNLPTVFNQLISQGTKSISAYQPLIDQIHSVWPTYDGGDPFYQQEIQRLQQSVPTTITDGTVDAWLYGCLHPQPDGGTVCAPACQLGFKTSYATCTEAVYYKQGGLLKRLSQSNEPTAIVYLANGNNFTDSDRLILVNDHKTKATVYQQQGSSTDYALSRQLDLSRTADNPNVQTSRTSSSSFWICLIIIVLVIIILVIVWPKQ